MKNGLQAQKTKEKKRMWQNTSPGVKGLLVFLFLGFLVAVVYMADGFTGGELLAPPKVQQPVQQGASELELCEMARMKLLEEYRKLQGESANSIAKYETQLMDKETTIRALQHKLAELKSGAQVP
ncbi:hypothetical protein JW758_05745 [Candidatus Peregrinibacteria bacterium]|nr:hypothetical protein [Candidatus Peregrinibacteria bacterium]